MNLELLSDPANNNKLLFGKYPFPKPLLSTISRIITLTLMLYSLTVAYTCRMHAVNTYGRLIHEFDPWFNYRATEYLSEHGWTAFFHWFDEMSWYPLGRPVGTTIYPGLQLTAVALHRGLNTLGVNMSLHNVCVYLPVWFSLLTVTLSALLSYECHKNFAVASFTALIMSTLPIHMVRSISGEFDSDTIIMAAMLLTFYLWVRSLRCPRAWPPGLLAGLAYGYTASAWGGYIFVINMVALHAGVSALVDWARGIYSPGLLRAYTLFYVVGTAIATRVPVVGMTPFKSLEQLSGLVVLVLLWCLHASEVLRARTNEPILSKKVVILRARVFAAAVGALAVGFGLLCASGQYIPISRRVKYLFFSPSSSSNMMDDYLLSREMSSMDAVFELLSICYFFWIIRVGIESFRIRWEWSEYTNSRLFAVLYSTVSIYAVWYNIRAIVLAAPIIAMYSGVLLDSAVGLMSVGVTQFVSGPPPDLDGRTDAERKEELTKATPKSFQEVLEHMQKVWAEMGRQKPLLVLGVRFMPFLLMIFCMHRSGYVDTVHFFAHQFQAPGSMFLNTTEDGREVVVRDYAESYTWLRENTPEDARVLAWWDYGYQITGAANRTTLMDGNAWNLEHVATMSKMFVSPVKEGHSLMRHVTDYVYVQTEGENGDLQIGPFMARLANSVYGDVCPGDWSCQRFGFTLNEEPAPLLRSSLLYHLVHTTPTITKRRKKRGGGAAAAAAAETTEASEEHRMLSQYFQEVYKSKNSLVRIYKVMNVSEESKKWIADRKNHVCSPPPDTWICPGQFPPAPEIQAMLRTITEMRARGQANKFTEVKEESEIEEVRKSLVDDELEEL